ncbi:MAG: DUF4838 domain-containing protein [Victivallales bacterium]
MKRLSLFLFLLTVMFSASAVQLADQGKPLAEIVIDPQADKAARFGAQELQHHLKLVTGGDFKIVTPETRKAENAIFVGDSEPVRKLGIRPSTLKTQEYVIAFRDNALILAGKDKKDSQIPLIHYNGVNTASGKNWPGLFDEQGTMYAVYDFLRDYCNVLWLDSTDAGTVITVNPSLKVKGKAETRKPFMEYRGGTFEFRYDPELWKRNEDGWLAYRKTAYPAIYGMESDLKKADQRVNQQSRLFLLRNKAGGTYRPANHSFYNYYERFLDKKHKNFEIFKPQIFAKNIKERNVDDFIFSSCNPRKLPPQLCYSNPETLAQVVKDIRDYFDNGGYHKRYRNVPTTGYIWGEDSFCVEAMDNGAFCQCPNCIKEYEMNRVAERAEYSTHWFQFVNKVAREIKKSHPGKKITTLAYGIREGIPSNVRLEDNIIVYFCLSANRAPHRDLLKSQINRLRLWRKTYPESSFALWLYNTFPAEIAQREKFHCFPGFFANETVRQYHLFKELNIRGGVFHCGFIDDFENYLNLRLMCDPSLSLQELKDPWFAAFGKAEKPIRAFYDLIEERYCNPNNYMKAQRHQNESIAWGLLGPEEVMKQLEQYMTEAEEKADTPQAKARVANWKAAYWDYMKSGTIKVKKIPCDQKGISIIQTAWLGRLPEPFGKSMLAGKEFFVQAEKSGLILNGKWFSLDKSFQNFTDGKFEVFNYIHSGKHPVNEILYHCEMPIDKLERFRVTVNRVDSSRCRVYFTPIGLINGQWVPIAPAVTMSTPPHWFIGKGKTFTTFDFYFAPGSLPGKLNGIGIRDESSKKGWRYPCYMQFEAK